MIVKVVLKTMQNARKLVSIVEPIPCDVELCCGRYAVNAKSMLGVLSMPDFEKGELYVHTDNDKECEQILHKLLEADLLMDTNDAACRSIYDITVFGEILIDFTSQRLNEDGQMLYARNPGGAPANVAVASSRLGAHTAFIGKAGEDMHGEFLRSVLQKENVDTRGMLLDKKYFTTLAFVEVNESGERTFSFARKPGADTQIQKEELDVDDCIQYALLKGNRDQAQVCQSVFSQIKKIFTSNKKFYMISGEQVPAITLRKKILQMDATAFENIVNIIIEKASTINNFHAYILSLINTTVEISDLKYTAECAAAQNDINSALI